MAGVMDELREHQAALEAIGESARDLKTLLGLVRAKLPPIVRMLRELSSDIEAQRRDRLRAAFAWALLGGLLGGLISGWMVLDFLGSGHQVHSLKWSSKW